MERLWQKDPESELYVDVFDNIPEKLSAIYLRLRSAAVKKQETDASTGLKNGVTAFSCMQEANRQMNKGRYREAMFLLNKSLCFVEIGQESGLESKCYSFRAVCFFQLKMYEKCLADIDIAKQSNAAPLIVSWMDRLRLDCMQQMKVKNRVAELVPKLSFKSHRRFPGLANVLTIKFNKEFGRHIIAKRDIPAGKTILLEEAMFCRSHGNKYSKCAVCLKTEMNFIPCENCANAIYCDNVCASAANNVHRAECADNWIETADLGNEFAMRSIFFAINSFTSIASLMEFVEGAVNEEKKAPHTLLDENQENRAYRAFLQQNIYLSDYNKRQMFSQAYVAYNFLLLRESIRKKFQTEREKRFLMHLCSHHMIIHSSNMFDSNDDRKCALVIMSYFNHSCAPNTLTKSKGNQQYCITSRPIKAGGQVFINYIGDLSSVNACKTFLQRTFNFQCICERCEPNVELMNKTAKNMLSDAGYQNWMKVFHRWQADHFDLERDLDRLLDLQEKTVEILNRFGSEHWCDELEYAADAYFYLLTAKSRPKIGFPWVLILIICVVLFFVFKYFFNL